MQEGSKSIMSTNSTITTIIIVNDSVDHGPLICRKVINCVHDFVEAFARTQRKAVSSHQPRPKESRLHVKQAVPSHLLAAAPRLTFRTVYPVKTIPEDLLLSFIILEEILGEHNQNWCQNEIIWGSFHSTGLPSPWFCLYWMQCLQRH